MSQPVPNFRWAFPDLPDWRSALKSVESVPPSETESAIRRWVWNLLWTGLDIPQLPGNRNNADGLMKHLVGNAALNFRLGPALSCGTISEIFIVACAAFGIYAREVCATNATDTPDMAAEVWGREDGWYLVLPQYDTHFCDSTGKKLSAERFAALEKAGQRGKGFLAISQTGGLPLVRSMAPVYAGWPGFGISLCVGSGNAHLFSPPAPWIPPELYQINADPDNRPNAFRGKPLALDEIYAPPIQSA